MASPCLLALIATLLLLTSVAAFREPDYSLAVDTAECQYLKPDSWEATGVKQLYLPFADKPESGEPARTVRCGFDLDLTEDETQDVALLIPSFSDSVTISVNGNTLTAAELHMMRNLRISALPVFVPRLDEALVPGLNQFSITVSALPGHTLALDRIFLGDPGELRSYYQSKWLLSAVIPTVVVGGEIALAVVFGLIWMARRHESEFGWLALTLVLAAARGTAIIPDFGLSVLERPFWNMLVVWETLTGLMFCRALTRMPSCRWTWLLAMPPLIFTLVYAFGPVVRLIPFLMATGTSLVVIYLAASVWTLTRAALRGDRDALVVMPGMIVLFAFVSHDISVTISAGASRIFLSRAVYGCFLLTIAALMTFRFVRAMEKLDNVAVALNQRVAEVEEQLRKTYEELRARREAEAIERERTRLMRDLHDGIGGELTTMLALADSGQPRPQEIARHARAALTDMRLIIGSLEDYGGDLPLALGTWRERAGPQLRATGLELIWQVRGVPTLTGMGPAHVLDVLRIVQEAVTNTMKHAHASRLWIATREIEDGICLSICDDGPHFNPGSAGNGIANMHTRAARLGARLTITRSDSKTCVTLLLPRVLPAIDNR